VLIVLIKFAALIAARRPGGIGHRSKQYLGGPDFRWMANVYAADCCCCLITALMRVIACGVQRIAEPPLCP
jgi:hypothetical protein